MQFTCSLHSYQIHFRLHPDHLDVGVTELSRKSVRRSETEEEIRFIKATGVYWLLSFASSVVVAPVIRPLVGEESSYLFVNVPVSLALYFVGVLVFGYFSPIIRGRVLGSPEIRSSKFVQAVILLGYLDFFIMPLRGFPVLNSPVLFFPLFILDLCLTLSMVYFPINVVFRTYMDKLSEEERLEAEKDKSRVFQGIDDELLVFYNRIPLEEIEVDYISVLHLYEEVPPTEQDGLSFQLDEYDIMRVEKGDVIGPTYRAAVPVMVSSDKVVTSMVPPKYIDVRSGVLTDELQNPFEGIFQTYGLSLEDNKIRTPRGNIFFADYALIERFVG